MSYPENILRQVQTYQPSGLATLQNDTAMIATMNTKFRDFNQMYDANLGSSITFDEPPQTTTTVGLVAKWQPADQKTQTLTVDQAVNTSYSFTNQQRIFNVEKSSVDDYLKVFGDSAIAEIGSAVEKNVALNAISAVPVMIIDGDGQSIPTGEFHTESGPYLYFGDGTTFINSYQQLAQMIANMRNLGSVKNNMKVYLPDNIIPSIIGSGLNQFVPRRNDEDAMSWELGEFGTPPVKYYSSNLLPIQEAGVVGNTAVTLTVTGVTVDSDGGISAITFSGAGTESDAIRMGDLLNFPVNGNTLFYRTYVGHHISRQRVQVRALANASSSGNSMTVQITPKLYSAAGNKQNISKPVSAGMTVTVVPSHVAGLLVVGDAFFLAMPSLGNQDPYASSAEYDDETGVSMRLTYGSVFGQNQKGLIHDAIWGSHLTQRYSMRIIIPLNQA